MGNTKFIWTSVDRSILIYILGLSDVCGVVLAFFLLCNPIIIMCIHTSQLQETYLNSIVVMLQNLDICFSNIKVSQRKNYKYSG